eukprot:5255951-Amphidinium_carterae.1
MIRLAPVHTKAVIYKCLKTNQARTIEVFTELHYRQADWKSESSMLDNSIGNQTNSSNSKADERQLFPESFSARLHSNGC